MEIIFILRKIVGLPSEHPFILGNLYTFKDNKLFDYTTNKKVYEGPMEMTRVILQSAVIFAGDMPKYLKGKQRLDIKTSGAEFEFLEFEFRGVKTLGKDLEPNLGYHKKVIKKGLIGEISKIREELDELEDAEAQGIKVMQLIELSDLLGAVELYLEKHFEGITLEDLIKMKNATKRAFLNGYRT